MHKKYEIFLEAYLKHRYERMSINTSNEPSEEKEKKTTREKLNESQRWKKNEHLNH